MADYFQVLGIQEGATPEEVRKAYTRSIRVHTPEQDPEGFRLIREAYEAIRDGKLFIEDGMSAPVNVSKGRQAFYERLEGFLENGSYQEVQMLCEDDWYLSKDPDPYVQYCLALAQLQQGHSGKAAKTAELLLLKEPEDKWFLRLYGIACQRRGWSKKAYESLKKAADKGCQDPVFAKAYGDACERKIGPQARVSVYMDALRTERKWKRSSFSGVEDLFRTLTSENLLKEQAQFDEVLDLYLKFIRDNGPEYVSKGNPDDIVAVAEALYGCPLCGPSQKKKMTDFFSELYQNARQEIEKDAYYFIGLHIELLSIEKDPDLPRSLKYLIRVSREQAKEKENQLAFLFARERERRMNDVILCLLAERRQLLTAMDGHFQTAYPIIYSTYSDQLKQWLRNESKAREMRASLLFDRMVDGKANPSYYDQWFGGGADELDMIRNLSRKGYTSTGRKATKKKRRH